MSNSQQSLSDFCDSGSDLCVTPQGHHCAYPLALGRNHRYPDCGEESARPAATPQGRGAASLRRGLLSFLRNHILISLAADDTGPELPYGQWENGKGAG